MNEQIKYAVDIIIQKLEQYGFMPMEEFCMVDSLIHRNKFLGIYSQKNLELVGETFSHDSTECYTEIELTFEIRLLGKSCDYVDFKEFDEKCGNFFYSLISDENFLIRGAKLGKAFQLSALKRLEKDMSFTVRIGISGDM